MKMKTILINFILISFSVAHSLEYSSTDTQTHLIELYTSQSCSSCPPAQNWLNGLKNESGLWKDYIPLAFHVSYWNHLSWRDQFSNEEYSSRQRAYNVFNQTGVYTPQVLINGADYRSWKKRPPKQTTLKKPGILKVIYSPQKNSAHFEFKTKLNLEKLECFGAFFENNHETKVKSGENSGERLKENFTVMALFHGELQKEKNSYVCDLKMNFKNANNQKPKGLVFWVANKNNKKVIQATGGYF